MKKLLLILILISSCTSKKNICILKNEKYKGFVEYHELNNDLNEFLKNR